VCPTTSIVFEELTQCCDLLEDPSITIVCFVQGLLTDRKRAVTLYTLSIPYTLDETCHKALEVEKLDKLYLVRRSTSSSRTPAQSVPKMSESSVSASTSKGYKSQVPPKVVPWIVQHFP